jgi:MYXO-CTERM domain-containing protein
MRLVPLLNGMVRPARPFLWASLTSLSFAALMFITGCSEDLGDETNPEATPTAPTGASAPTAKALLAPKALTTAPCAPGEPAPLTPTIISPTGMFTAVPPQPTIKWTVPAEQGPTVTYEVRYNFDAPLPNGTVISFANGVYSWTADPPFPTSQARFTVVAKNCNGEKASAFVDVLVDATPPNIQPYSPDNSSQDPRLYGVDGILFEAGVADDEISEDDGVTQVRVLDINNPVDARTATYDPDTLSYKVLWTATKETPQRVCWFATDKNGNTTAVADARCVNIKADLNPPAAPIPDSYKDGTASPFGGFPIFSWLPGEGSDLFNTSYTFELIGQPPVFIPIGTSYQFQGTLGERKYSWRVTAQDASGNTASSPLQTFFIDAQAPNAPQPISPFSPFYTQSRKPVLCWSPVFDNGPSGVTSYVVTFQNSVEYFVDAPTDVTVGQVCLDFADEEPLTDGVYIWEVRAVDLAGNRSERFPGGLPNFVVVDNVAPSTPSVSAPGEFTIVKNGPVKFEWAASTDDRLLSGYVVRLSDSLERETESTSYEWNDDIPEGIYQWWILAVDEAGNRSGPSTSRTLTVDRTGPTTPILTQPDPASTYVGSTSPTFAWSAASDAVSGVARYFVTIDGGAPTKITETEFKAENLSDGPHTFEVYAEDVAGNVGSSTQYSFTVDSSAPTAATVTSPATGACVDPSSVAYAFEPCADDQSGITDVRVLIDGTPAGPSVPAGTTSGTANLSILPAGTYTVGLRCTNGAGLSVDSATVSIKINKTAPTCALTRIDASTTDTSEATVTIEVTDPSGCGVSAVTARFGDGSPETADFDATEKTYSVAQTLAEGDTSITCTVTGIGGTTFTSEEYTARVDECAVLGECDATTRECYSTANCGGTDTTGGTDGTDTSGTTGTTGTDGTDTSGTTGTTGTDGTDGTDTSGTTGTTGTDGTDTSGTTGTTGTDGTDTAGTTGTTGTDGTDTAGTTETTGGTGTDGTETTPSGTDGTATTPGGDDCRRTSRLCNANERCNFNTGVCEAASSLDCRTVPERCQPGVETCNRETGQCEPLDDIKSGFLCSASGEPEPAASILPLLALAAFAFSRRKRSRR